MRGCLTFFSFIAYFRFTWIILATSEAGVCRADVAQASKCIFFRVPLKILQNMPMAYGLTLHQ